MAIRPSDRSILNRAASCAATLVLAIGIAHAADAPSGASVNGQALPAATVRTLEQAYRVPIAPGRYWYDAMSGAWGREGGPIAGQMMPGLRLGGPLAADASRGNSQVFINGRELMVARCWPCNRLAAQPSFAGVIGSTRRASAVSKAAGALQPGSLWPVVGPVRRVEHPHLLRQRRQLQLARVVGWIGTTR